MNLKCPECGSTDSFEGHQRVYVDVIVDSSGTFINNLCGSTSASIYKADKPYGPWTCKKCQEIFDTDT